MGQLTLGVERREGKTRDEEFPRRCLLARFALSCLAPLAFSSKIRQRRLLCVPCFLSQCMECSTVQSDTEPQLRTRNGPRDCLLSIQFQTPSFAAQIVEGMGHPTCLPLLAKPMRAAAWMPMGGRSKCELRLADDNGENDSGFSDGIQCRMSWNLGRQRWRDVALRTYPCRLEYLSRCFL
jgi:hypothetical protein